MKSSRRASVLAVISVILFVGCGIVPTPAPTPTATPLPTNTPLPTATVQPTAMRPQPTATPANALPPAVAFALNKTQSARSLDFDFSTGITNVSNGKTTELPGLAVKGQDSTLNRHVTVSGTTSDTNEFITYEVIVFGDNVYVKGLTGVPGIDPAVWYILPAEMQSGVRRLPTARGLLSSFNAEDFASAKFSKAGTEALDEETCTVWEAQNPATIQKIIGVNDSETLKQQLGEIDGSTLKLWTCADGYIHKIEGQVLGHNAQNKNDTVSINLYFKMNQFDRAFDFQAPPDAKPFTPEAESTATVTPENSTPKAQATPTQEHSTPKAQATPTPKTTASPAP